MLAFKGIDNLSYYRTVPATRHYMDYTARELAQPCTRPCCA